MQRLVYDQQYVLIVQKCHFSPLLWVGLHFSSRHFATPHVRHSQHCYVLILNIFDFVPCSHRLIQGFSVMIFCGKVRASYLICLAHALVSIAQALSQLVFSFCLFLYRASSFFMLIPLFPVQQVFSDTFYSCEALPS